MGPVSQVSVGMEGLVGLEDLEGAVGAYGDRELVGGSDVVYCCSLVAWLDGVKVRIGSGAR